MTRAARLKRILNPDRVAWVGGGGLVPAIGYMRAHGFAGEAVAMNPKRAEIAGLPCVAAIAGLPWAPDLAILVLPKQAVAETVRDLAKIGCGGAICITSGFSEAAGGAGLQADLIAAAGEMPVIGPNCPGLANFLDGRAFMMDHFGAHAPARGVAVISNGGAYLSDLGCADRSQPIAYLIGLGNQAMVGVADMMDVVLDDPRVTAVNVYFETLGDAAQLSHAAAKAARKGVPVLAIKGGRSQAGRRAAQSHTAALSGDAEVASALFRRFGWIEVRTPSEAIENLKMLSYTPVPRGMRAGFVTSSGSYAVLGGDIAERLGLRMDPPGEEAASALSAVLPDYVGPANPLDISDAHGWPLKDQCPIYEAFARDDHDLFVQVMCYPPEGGWDMATWDTTTTALAHARGPRPAAFVNTLAEALPKAARERMIANGIAPLQGLEDGLRAVAHAAHYGARRDRLDPSAMLLGQAESGAEVPRTSGSGEAPSPEVLSEAEAKRWLAAAGLDVPRQWAVAAPDGTSTPPFDCAVKAMIPGLLHKTEAGAVALNISPGEVRNVMRSMSKTLAGQGLRAEGFLVEEMIPGAIGELLIGLRRVDGIGLTLTLALGGIAVELLQDRKTVILPAPRAEIDAALRGLRLAPLLLGHRGRPQPAWGGMLDAIEALIRFAEANPHISELEVNPLLLTETRAVIVDAVLAIAGKGTP